LLCTILGPILGCFLSGTWHEGANTFWKPIDYFPYPVKAIIVMKPIGREIWIESIENEIYQIIYPCSKDKICWLKADAIPSDASTLAETPVDYNFSMDKCENSRFMYPLFHKITMCITSAVHAPDATHTVSLPLTSDNKLWVWDQDYEDPFSIMISLILSTIGGGLVGYITGVFLAAFIPFKKKRKKK